MEVWDQSSSRLVYSWHSCNRGSGRYGTWNCKNLARSCPVFLKFWYTISFWLRHRQESFFLSNFDSLLYFICNFVSRKVGMLRHQYIIGKFSLVSETTNFSLVWVVITGLVATIAVTFIAKIFGNYASNCQNKSCNFKFDPVCGKDKNGNIKAFSNPCRLRIHACKHLEQEWDLLENLDATIWSENTIWIPLRRKCEK